MEQIQTQQFKSFSDIEVYIINTLEKFSIDKYDLSEVIRKIRNKLIEEFITKYNLYGIQSHKLRDNRDLYNLDKFIDIENFVKSTFSKYTKEDRIKELLFRLDSSKLLNQSKKPYYSWSDIIKDYPTKEQFIKELSLKCSKEILFSCWALSDKYRRYEYLRQLKKLLKVVFDIDLIIDNMEGDLKTIEETINKQELGFKVRFFREWFYISFSDKTQHNQLLNRVLEQEIKTYENMHR